MSDAVEVFSIRVLHLIDEGELEKDFEDQLKRLVADCMARPGIDKSRKLILTLEVTPAVDSKGQCDDVFVECFTSSKCPNRPVKPYRMAANVRGGLRFQPGKPMGGDLPAGGGE